ncbi:hypothetical protein [Mycobacteroides abscessus]|uniref:hypothetical protein n=1 Tax=Mycobacteroides abscessus TaxID=36809 RepID=UPI0002683D81|nr:hypothetical protein [Mycobacteroides abscessus]EIV28254.1 hypothetical protein MM2B0912S_0307 [Mycobacteroides abscessus subsp. bolletii 2B-0912-S]
MKLRRLTRRETNESLRRRWAFFQAHLRDEFVHSAQGEQVLKYAFELRRVNRPDTDVEHFKAVVAAERDVCEARARAALDRVNPASVLVLGVILERAGQSRYRQFLGTFGMSRLVWLIGAAGGGTGPLGEGIREFFDCAVPWLAVTALESELWWQPTGRDPDDATVTAVGSRMVNAHTRLWWGSLMVARSLLRQARRPELPETIVPELVQYLVAANGANLRERAEFILPPLSTQARTFATACSVRAGQYAGRRLDDLVNTRIDGESSGGQPCETYPFILVGEQLVPATIYVLRGSLHVMFVDYLRRTLKDEGSQIFERTCGDLIRELLGTDGEMLTDVNIRISHAERKHKGQTDFAALWQSVLLIGEVKAALEPVLPRKSGASYDRDVGKAFTQLNERLAAAAAGSSVSAAGRMVKAEEYSQVRGLGVVMHDFGGEIWRHRAHGGKFKDSARLPIITVQDLAVIAHTLSGMDEFLRYLDFRQQLLGAGVRAMEEFDILAGFLARGPGPGQQLTRAQRRATRNGKGHIRLAARAVPLSLQHVFEPPVDKAGWRQIVAGMPRV